MPLHARRRIVLAVVAALQDLPSTGARVFAGRATPAPASIATTPYLLVYARHEDSRGISEDDDGRRLQRGLTLAVEGVTASSADDDAALDAIAFEVEQAMGANTTLGGLIKDIELTRTDLNARAEGESRTGRVRLEFTVEYHTPAGRPDQSLD